MDNAAQLITTLMGVGGAGVIVGQVIRWLMKRADGSSNQQRIKNTGIVMDRVKAIEERDQADAKRLILQEYAARGNRRQIENGMEPEPWPDLEHTIPKDQIRRLRRKPPEPR